MTMTKARPSESSDAGVDRFLVSLEQRAAGYPVDLTEPVATLRAALGDVPDEESFVQAVATVERIESKVSQLSHLGSGPHMSTLMAGQVASARSLLHRAMEVPRVLSDAERSARDDVEKAEADIATTTEALSDAERQLAEAVEVADLEAIIRLRAVVEVTGPGRVNEARIRMVDARLALATAQAGPLAKLAATAVAPVKAAQAVADKARNQLEAAETALQKLDDAVATAQDDVDQNQAEVDRLTAERERLTAQHQTDRRERTRKLAGLAPEPTTPLEPVTPPPRNLIRTPKTAFFRS